MKKRGLEDRGKHEFQVARRQPGEAIFVRDDLALFGDLYCSIHGSIRLSQDGGVGGPTSSSDGATPTMKEPEMDTVVGGGVLEQSL